MPILARRRFRALVAAASVAAAMGAGPRPAAAQSDNDLRRENDALRARARFLETELEAAQKKIAELEGLVEDLRRTIGRALPSQPHAAPPEPSKVTLDESVPNASPRALHQELQSSYQEAIGELQIGEPGDRQRRVYLRAVENWARRVNRLLRAQIVWHVRVLRLPGSDEPRLELQAVDPDTDVPLGEPFAVLPPRPVLERLDTLDQRGRIGEVMILRGVLSPNVLVNQDRVEAGTFDRPRFIGPFAEYEMSVIIASLALADQGGKAHDTPQERPQEPPPEKPRG